MANLTLKTKKYYLLTLSFVSGLTIMAVELSASRLIAPFFGTSNFIWTNIIGVIMLALAIGYYVGGKLADKRPELNLLLKIIFFACCWLLLIPFTTKPLVETLVSILLYFQSATLYLFLGSLITVGLLFIVPIILLGVVSPFIIRLLSEIDSQVGKDAGLVFSISTCGSIIGTFLPVLLFIPYFGTKKTIIFFVFLLLFVALLGLGKRKWLSLLVIFILPVLALNLSVIKTANGTIYQTESAYQYLQVTDENNLRYLRVNEGLGSFSVVNKEPGQILTGAYYDLYNLLPYLSGNFSEQNILILGLAGGTISTQLNHFFSADYQLQIDGVEIDSKIIEVGRKFFNLENESLTVHNMDGRNFLEQTKKKYNSIIIDVYANQLYIPFQMTTREFFAEAKQRLQPQGVVAINVNATSFDSALLKNITNTLKLVFSHVYLLPVSEESMNYMVVAVTEPIDISNLKKYTTQPELQPIIDQAQNTWKEVDYDNNFTYLTDDKAPIEHLTDWMIIDYVFKNKL